MKSFKFSNIEMKANVSTITFDSSCGDFCRLIGGFGVHHTLSAIYLLAESLYASVPLPVKIKQ